MPKNLGKKRFIESFLENVSRGVGFIQDIWIPRKVKLPGTGSDGNVVITQAHSLSRNPISNITELLQDDLNYTFIKGLFTFRLIAAIPGSGKTALLLYLQELIKVTPEYCNRSVVFFFELRKVIGVSSNQRLANNFYSYILAQSFWQMLKNPDIENMVGYTLTGLVKEELSSTLKNANDFETEFLPCFYRFFSESNIHPESAFFFVINQIFKVKPDYVFVYLIDELDDVLRENPDYEHQIRSIFRTLINKIASDYNNNLRFIIYLAGTSDIVNTFINTDFAFKSRIPRAVINLVSGRSDEFDQIKKKIVQRIKGAHSGSLNFKEAYDKIHNIEIHYPDNYKVLRNFCHDYAEAVLKIYNDSFKEEPENCFEGNNRHMARIVETICKRNWADYIEDSDSGYKLSVIESAVKNENYAFNCYAKLLKDGNPVASAYGGCQNYELLSNYVDEFIQELKRVDFTVWNLDKKPTDIAFIIAPECSLLLGNKLKLHNINFLDESEKNKLIELPKEEKTVPLEPVDINLCETNKLIKIFDGTRMPRPIINEIISKRPYKELDELLSRVKSIGQVRREKIQQKIESGQICFRYSAFISYNRKDGVTVKKIINQLQEKQILVWQDVAEISSGEQWQLELEKYIERDMFASAIIFIGENGIGPYQRLEIEAFLRKDASMRRLSEQGYPIIPVKLRTKGKPIEGLGFLESYGWVDFNNFKTTVEALQELINGIKRKYI